MTAPVARDDVLAAKARAEIALLKDGVTSMPSMLVQERERLAELDSPDDLPLVVLGHRRIAAIRELMRRAKVAVPIQNEAVVYEIEALTLMAKLVDEGQASGEIAPHGGDHTSKVGTTDLAQPKSLKDLSVKKQDLHDARLLAKSGAVEKAKKKAAKVAAKPITVSALLADAKKAKSAKAKEADRKHAAQLAVKPFAGRCELLTGDLLDAGAAIETGSVDAIVTDPPYSVEFLPLWGRLGELAARVLRPGGWLVAMAPHAHLPQLLSLLDVDGLVYRWTLSYLLPSGESAQLQSLRLNVRWKPVLLFTAGKLSRIPTFGSDVLENAVQDEDRHDDGWGQGLDGFSKLVAGVTRADEMVLDPFLGSGTTAAAALKQGRRFVGIDVDEKYVAETWHRLDGMAK